MATDTKVPPVTLAPRSPLLARVANDGVYLRAMIGSLWWFAPIVGAVLGAAAAVDTNGQALRPRTPSNESTVLATW